MERWKFKDWEQQDVMSLQKHKDMK
jgi:hypothetical protein